MALAGRKPRRADLRRGSRRVGPEGPILDLILLRHGKSPPLHEAGVSTDEERPLSELGQKQAKRAGKALGALECQPSLVLASPLVRARQTADAAVKGLGGSSRLKVFEPLAAGADPEGLVRALAPFAGEPRLLLVGHQPDLGVLATKLLFGSESGAIVLKPGGMMLIELDRLELGARAELRWLLQPAQIERIA